MIDDLDDDDDVLEEKETEENEGVEEDVASLTDNVGDPSVEINVEELISEFEAQGLSHRLDREKDAKHRLEELMERRRAHRELEDFEDYEI